MDNLIDTRQKKKKNIIIKEVKPEPAPDISFAYRYQFKAEALTILDDKLSELGIVIPRNRMEQLENALVDIGKLYYSYVTTKTLF